MINSRIGNSKSIIKTKVFHVNSDVEERSFISERTLDEFRKKNPKLKIVRM